MRPIARFAAAAAGALLVLVLALLVVIPHFFSSRIAARLKAGIASSVNARVEWGGASLGLLRDFPNVSLGLDRVVVTGQAPFAGDTLAAVQHARLVLDVRSVIGYLRAGRHIVVRDIILDHPALALRVLPDGRANWDIARTRAPAAGDTASAVGVTLRNLRITDGSVTYDDAQSHVAATVCGLRESLGGDFGRRTFTLVTRTHADTVSLRFAGLPWLNRVSLDVNADVAADLAAGRFTFRNDSLRLNQLVLAFGGTVAMTKPNVNVDLAFSTPGTRFADILSLVPAVYASDFAHLRTAGTMSTSLRVRGAYGPGVFPMFALRAHVANGAFRDPALPLPARDIFLDLAVDNPGGALDRTIVTMERFHAVLGSRPLDARLSLRTPVSDPDADLRLAGSVDLADVGRTVKLSGVRELRGVVAADLAMHARRSDVNARRYDRVDGRGTMTASRVAVSAAAMRHPVAVDTAALRFTPRSAEIAAFSARAGQSDVSATGGIDNILGWLLHDDVLRGSATVTSRVVNLDEWRTGTATTAVIPVPPHVDFQLAATAARVVMSPLTLANVRGGLHVNDQRVTLDDLHLETLRGSLVASGFYETTTPARPTFDIALTAASIDIPTAFATLSTVRMLAPVARWARGGVSGTTRLRGTLDTVMTPVFSTLTGAGAFETERLVMQDAPVLAKLADALRLDQLRHPSLGIVKAAFQVADGRVRMHPFTVPINGMNMTVAGSNGIDQSIDYQLGLALPRALLGGSAGAVVTDLAAKAGRLGLATGDVVQVAALVTGTVLDPAVRPTLGDVAASAGAAVQQAAATQVAAVRQRVDSAADGARRRAREQAARLVSDAEGQAARIREGGRALAARAKAEGNARADSLLARATSPVARMAAQVAVDRARREADQQSDRIIHDADARADLVVAQARKQAGAAVPPSP